MKHFEVFLAVMLLPLPVLAADHAVPARVATLTIDPREVTILNLRPEFESSIRMPEDVTSVILGSPGAFKAEHNEGEPRVRLRQTHHQGTGAIEPFDRDQIRPARDD